VSSTVFRKVSLDRLSSPEQLDELMKVTDPRGWLILCAFGVVLVTALVWGVMGSVPQDVSGVGMLVKSGGVFQVIASSAGRITDVAVRVGDVVTEGRVVARMAQPDLADRLAEAKAVLAALRSQREEIQSYGSRDSVLQTQLLAKQRATLEQTMTAARQSAQWYEEKIHIQEKLVAEGLLTKQTLLNTQQQLDATRQRIGDGHSELAQIAVRELDLRNRHHEEVRAIDAKIDAQLRTVGELERDIKGTTEIVAQQTGRILEIMTEQGAVVGRGEPILTLDLMGRTVKDLEAVLYVPSIYGKQVRAGMPVFIAPSTVKREEYGLMLGRVTYVSDYPATPRGMQRVLKNDKLVGALAGSDAPYEIHADLLVDEQTVSRYRWSSSQGPPVKIQSGTFATAQITVVAERPIAMVVPLLRKYTGL
jgi:HlyD family secretion protein